MPRCTTPPRLHDLVIKNLNLDDFACLPDVSPTTMYLEISEGKNVSLLCQVSAVPEARVSWWFQGRVLQNDSMVAPGLHLYYFVEEGTLEKKSELFIFNTNTEDNGTFVCVAENPAGRAQSNYTIRIIVREEVAVAVVLQFEYVIAIVAAIGVLALLVVIVLILLIIRCRRHRNRRRKRERSKVIALQSPEPDKAVGDMDANMAITRMHKLMVANPGPAKVNGAAVALPLRRHEVLAGEAACGSACTQMSPNRTSGERNPDLINDTDEKQRSRREEGDGEDRENSGHNSYQEAMDNIIDDFADTEKGNITWRDDSGFPLKVLTPMRDIPPNTFSTLPRRVIAANTVVNKEAYQHAADVHLSPGRFLDQDGYPIDFGLPKLPIPPPPMALPIVPPPPHPSYYRTLPYNRGHNKMSQYPREAEYLPGPQYDVGYTHEPPTDIRYSVEGYPTSAPPVFAAPNDNFPEPINNFIPSPPAAYKSDAPAQPEPIVTPGVCAAAPWPTHFAAGASKQGSESQQNLIESAINAMVSAQPEPAARAQQESPDEGYEDENIEM
ncbi:hypothetical protein B566_EDAN002187 [Ephemera danica]|nr:hypothetical protein B566_EDAN002187 [Ephemera danica]